MNFEGYDRGINRGQKKNATPALRPRGRGGVFLSAKIERMQEKNTGREGRTVLTQREDSAAVICLHRKPENRKRKEQDATPDQK